MNTTNCSYCHSENYQDARFCRKCGKDLSEDHVKRLGTCKELIRKYPDYSQILDSAIFQMFPDIQWGITSLRGNSRAHKVGKTWCLPYHESNDITLYHNKDYKSITYIEISKGCNIKSLHPVFESWDLNFSFSEWKELLRTANIIYDEYGFSQKTGFFGGLTMDDIFEKYGGTSAGNLYSLMGKMVHICFRTSNFSVSLYFHAYTEEQHNTLKSITISYLNAEKASFWQKF